MKKTLFFVLALTAICIMPSCKKDKVKDKVVFGDRQGMTVTPYDSTFYPEQYGHFSWGNTVDLDGDGQNDVQFHSQDVGSAGLGHDVVTKLECKHENIELFGDIINQEKYLHIDSTFHTEDSIWWVIGIYETYTCERIAETDSIVSTTEKLSLYANNPNDGFDKDDTFMSTDVVLKNRSYFYPAGTENGDHVLYHYDISYENDCDYFPMDEEKYIGFKITKNDRSRLGWMKVILHDDYVELLETAIQK